MSLAACPVEILREILAHTVTDCFSFTPLPLCLVSHQLRAVAYSTPDLWQNLCVSPVIHRVDAELLVKTDFIEFVSHWFSKLGNGNQFSLCFRHTTSFDTAVGGRQGLVPLDSHRAASLFRLFGRSRYLEIHHDMILLQVGDEPRSFPYLESLVVENAAEDSEFLVHDMLAFYNMPALRKLSVNRVAFDDPSHLSPLASRDYLIKWGKLTHISALFTIDRFQDWKEIIRQSCSVERAHLTLFLRQTDVISTHAHTSVVTHPSLRELFLFIRCDVLTNRQASALFEDIYLPALETLQLHGAHLSFDGFLALTAAAPFIQRLRLGCLFPTRFAMSTGLDENGDIVQFPLVASSRLTDHAPKLRHIMVDVPRLSQFRHSFRPYIDAMRKSGWLEGPWNDGPPRFEFYWSKSFFADMKPMVDDLYSYLSAGENGLAMEVGLRRWDEAMVPEPSERRYWDDWCDVMLEFRAARVYT